MIKTNKFGLVEEFKTYPLTLDPSSSPTPSQLAKQQRICFLGDCENTTSVEEADSGPLTPISAELSITREFV